ncbi:uncharacterized protein TRAVEDRAFT_122287 [Trametes versicolor FP-101664 SS1]|uniref:uncharacterized protein n=1 Tax=Trametes versicolor (strain FP-101664) TaxID=717944 RepID=UPI0004623AA1|nr:uncharacterized protein TRAVEDRAFT_122287 [Trametes versicolor FP-101664 SS1]EIW59339.1 hypothetical protein TRAVEDRAFT_122287 [Trametes versicolor FP-101664 SS1]
MSAWTRPRTTLAGLATVARLCPKLDWLGWELDASLDALPPARLERRPGLGMVPRHVFTLNVGLSPIEDPWAVAAFLSDIFPWLESIDHGWKALEFDQPDGQIDQWGLEREGWSLPKRYGVRWENARALIAKFAKIRGHERAWKREKTGEKAPEYQLELGEDPEEESD